MHLLHYLLVMLITFIFLKVPHVISLNFTFPNFNQNNTNKIIFAEDSKLSNGSISLTADRQSNLSTFSSGRITYSELLYLGDKKSGIVTNFSTNFTFSIDSLNNSRYADGMAFFLAPINLPPPVAGNSLGLPGDNHNFVAVKFDTFQNYMEPYPLHVGININSIQRSTATEKWENSIKDGKENYALVSYDSISKNLSVTYTNFNGSVIFMRHLSFRVNLIETLPEMVVIGFSAATGADFEKHILKSWNFSSSLTPLKRSNKLNSLVWLSILGIFVILIGIFCIFLWLKNRNDCDEDIVVGDDQFDEFDDDFESGTGPRKFSYNDLIRATDNFSEHEKLGQGGFGSVYRGFLKELNCYIAVKRVSRDSKQGMKEYASEVKIISKLRHRNLVQLLGWCHVKMDLLLVYEFMPNGSLDTHLFKQENLLPWDLRYKISLGLASGLFYLQEEWEQCVLHRDIKSSNIMLDSKFNAKLGDFGLARLVDHDKNPTTTILAGTMGYMAPECVVTGKASKESDVYSFGVVCLEIACGRRPIDYKANDDQNSLIQWVWNLYGDLKLLEAADPRLNGEFDEEQMTCLMILGLWCVHPFPNSRPSIRQAIQVLNFEVSLPILQPEMPVPQYLPSPRTLSSLSMEVTESCPNQISRVPGSLATSPLGSSTSVLLMHTR